MAELAVLEERSGIGIATIMARNGVSAAAIGAALGIKAPSGPYRSTKDETSLIGTGPGTWLAIREGATPDWFDSIRSALAGLASVSDQSGGYAYLRLSGPSARTMMQRGAYVDLDPSAFPANTVATTVIAHIGVTFWADEAGSTFDIILFRSFADSFKEWVTATAAGL